MLPEIITARMGRVSNSNVGPLVRRARIALYLAVACSISLAPAHARSAASTTQCTPDALYGGYDCTSQVNFSQFAQNAYQTQQLTEWCWAASTSMIWAFYGHSIAQSEIVTAIFGSQVNMGAQPSQIFEALNGPRVDDQGNHFNSVVTGLYDAMSGIYDLDYTQIGASLDQNRPVLIGTVNPDGSGAHATVLTELSYYVAPGSPIEVLPDGSNIISGGVFDPWPGNGAHSMSPAQLAPANIGGSLFFAALVSVTNVATSTSPGSTRGSAATSGGKGGGAVDGIFWALVALAFLLARSRVANASRAVKTR